MSSPELKSLLRRHLLKRVFSMGSFTVVVVSQNSSHVTGQRSEMLVRSFFMHHQPFGGACHYCDDMRGNTEHSSRSC